MFNGRIHYFLAIFLVIVNLAEGIVPLLHLFFLCVAGPGALQRARRSHRAVRILPAPNAKVPGPFLLKLFES